MLQFFSRWLKRRSRSPELQRFVQGPDLGRKIRWFGVYLLSIMVLHIAAMVILEGLTPFEALWLTLTTMTTVGYGDLSAETVPGRLATIFLVFIGGIFVLFQAAATYFEFREDRRHRMIHGRWRWNMRDHILLLNIPAECPTAYLVRLVCDLRASHRFADLPVQIVTSRFETGLPEDLHDLGVVHYAGNADNPKVLEAAGGRDAAIVIVLAREEVSPSSDGRTFDILDRLTELGAKGRILAECVDDTNRARLRRAGAHIIVRPMRGYPEMIVRALVAPGAEAILEDLFTTHRDECWRYDIRVSGLRWADIVRVLVESDVGLPIAFRSVPEGQLRVNPPPNTRIDTDKLFVIVREGNNRRDDEVGALLAKLA